MALVPSVRFQEFLNEWKCTKMSACIDEIVGGAPLSPKDILDEGDFKIIPKKAIQAGGKIIISDACNYVKKEIYEKYNSNHAKKGDLIIVLRDLVPTGPSIGYIVENDKVEEGILAQGVYAFRTTDVIDNDFLIQYSNSPQYRKLMQTIMVGSTQVHIKNSVYLNIDMPHGELKEQQKIAEFLSSVDDVIQLQEGEIFALEEQKKGVMQKLFNREVRFKADDGNEYPEWEERTFDEIFNVIQNNTFSRDCLNDEIGEVLNIHYGDVLIKYGAFIDVSKEEIPHINDDIQLNKFDEKSYLRNGDIIIADTAEDMTVGKATEICGAIGKKILSGLHTIPCRPKATFVSKYLGYYINSEKYHNQLIPLIQGIKVSSISKSNISKTMIIYPCAKEQKKIADCLSTYNEAIQIKKNKLEVWKEIKRGLLQQMFV